MYILQMYCDKMRGTVKSGLLGSLIFIDVLLFCRKDDFTAHRTFCDALPAAGSSSLSSDVVSGVLPLQHRGKVDPKNGMKIFFLLSFNCILGTCLFEDKASLSHLCSFLWVCGGCYGTSFFFFFLWTF